MIYKISKLCDVTIHACTIHVHAQKLGTHIDTYIEKYHIYYLIQINRREYINYIV